MPKVSVLREVKDLTGTELFAVYEGTTGPERDAAKAEMLNRLDPPKRGKPPPIDMQKLLKGRK